LISSFDSHKRTTAKKEKKKKNVYQFGFIGRTLKDRILISERIRSSSLLGIFYTKPQEEEINKNHAFCIFWDLVTNFVFLGTLGTYLF